MAAVSDDHIGVFGLLLVWLTIFNIVLTVIYATQKCKCKGSCKGASCTMSSQKELFKVFVILGWVAWIVLGLYFYFGLVKDRTPGQPSLPPLPPPITQTQQPVYQQPQFYFPRAHRRHHRHRLRDLGWY